MAALLEIKNLSKVFPGKGRSVTALSDVSFHVNQGEIFGIIGLSGAGKSTLVRSLALLERPSSGDIVFEGNSLTSMKKLPLRTYRKKVGMIFQQFNLLSSRTVFENIAYPLEITNVPKEKRRTRIVELLKLVNLSGKIDAYPTELSGGEKQRVGIARALANHPDLLLCDEATSALDPKTTTEILNLLRQLNRDLGLTIVLITHEMDVIKQICNRVAVLEGGALVECGPVSEVFTDPKHPTTKSFLQQTHHHLPAQLLKAPSPTKKMLRLSFKGESAKTPVISQMIRSFSVDANILMGWVDALESTIVGTLFIEVEGSEENVTQALAFLKENTAHCEEVTS